MPTLAIVAECDPPCNEGGAGVAVDCQRHDGMLHPFFTLEQVFDDGRASLACVCAALTRALA